METEWRLNIAESGEEGREREAREREGDERAERARAEGSAWDPVTR
jgi:hypothetical protein